MFKRGFTLAEVLITLAIIGVVAAISIPSVISNSQQQEFKTGLRKAVSVLNSAITMNMAIDGESPYDNANLFGYLTRHMSTLKAPATIDFAYYYKSHDGSVTVSGQNYGFYTTDGIRFEYYSAAESTSFPGPKLHESGVRSCVNNADGFYYCNSVLNPNLVVKFLHSLKFWDRILEFVSTRFEVVV